MTSDRRPSHLSTIVRRIAITLVAALAGFAGWLLWYVGNPPTTTTPTGDAIFVHAGGSGERVRTAVELFEGGVAPTLVLSDPEPGSVPPTICSSDASVVCFVPSPADTAGEAAALGSLAADRSWDTVVVVTSDYHVRRAIMLDRSCTDATILPVAAPSRRAGRPISDVEVEEAVSLVFSWLAQRCA